MSARIITDVALKTILADFITRMESGDKELADKIKGLNVLRIAIVSQLPQTGDSTTLYVLNNGDGTSSLQAYTDGNFVNLSGTSSSEGGEELTEDEVTSFINELWS